MLPEDVREPGASRCCAPVTIPDEGINFTSVVSQLERELILRVPREDRRQQAAGRAAAAI